MSELRLSRASTIEEANRVLWAYLSRHNQRFTVPAAEVNLAYRQADSLNLDELFCFKYSRVVGMDNVVRFGDQRLQILPSNGRLSYARTRVEIQQRLNGSLAVYYQGQCLLTRPAPTEPSKLRKPEPALSSSGQRRYAKPAPDHPWRGIFRVHIDRG